MLTWHTHLSMSTSLSQGSLQMTFIGTLNAAEFIGYGHSCQIRGKRGLQKISYSTHGRKSSDNLAEGLDGDEILITHPRGKDETKGQNGRRIVGRHYGQEGEGDGARSFLILSEGKQQLYS